MIRREQVDEMVGRVVNTLGEQLGVRLWQGKEGNEKRCRPILPTYC